MRADGKRQQKYWHASEQVPPAVLGEFGSCSGQPSEAAYLACADAWRACATLDWELMDVVTAVNQASDALDWYGKEPTLDNWLVAAEWGGRVLQRGVRLQRTLSGRSSTHLSAGQAQAVEEAQELLTRLTTTPWLRFLWTEALSTPPPDPAEVPSGLYSLVKPTISCGLPPGPYSSQ